MKDWIAIGAQPEKPMSLRKALRAAGGAPESPCGGRGICGKCRVWAKGALTPPGETERTLLGEHALAEGIRLACLTEVIGQAWACPCAREQTIEAEQTGTLPTFAPDVGAGYGFAADIGTTTLAMSLYRRSDGSCCGSVGGRNPQTAFGADVIARIERAMAGDAQPLAEAVRVGLNTLLGQLCTEAGVSREQITAGAIAGNTAMLYLLTGHPTAPLSAAPFAADRLFGEWVTAEGCGLSCGMGAQIYLAPCISAYVGGDLVAAALAARLTEYDRPVLLVDVGTNGEMALVHDGRMYTCATAAGPAFEGAGISCGMPAAAGAVDHVRLEAGRVSHTTVGAQPAVGLCGSGLLDAVRCLLETGLVDETGAIDEEAAQLAGLLCEGEETLAVHLWESGIRLTQRDIRALQLAKGAICAGIETLLHEAKLEPHQMDRLLIAGGFGSYLDPESAERIGLLPQGFAVRTQAIGNAACTGAGLLLLSERERIRAEQEAQTAVKIDLAGNSYFAAQYIERMLF